MSDWGAVVRRSAVVTLSNGDVLPGNIHLLGAVAHRPGPETPIEMVNRPEGFFPLTFDDGGVLLLAKGSVAMVTCDAEPAPPPDKVMEESEEPIARTVLSLELVLVTGEEVRGEARPDLWKQELRLLDFLNEKKAFFELYSESGIRLVNRAHVRLVRPLD